MKGGVKKSIVILLLLGVVNLYAQEKYKIESVDYVIDGKTQQSIVAGIANVNTKTVFSSKKDVEDYAKSIQKRFNNTRQIQSVHVKMDYGSKKDDYTAVTCTVFVTDTNNFLLLPYPRFDSNSGYELKLKFIDNNFFGTLHKFESDIILTKNFDKVTELTSNGRFSYPFRAGPLYATVLTSGKMNIPFQKKAIPYFEVFGQLGFSYPFKVGSFDFGLAHTVVLNKKDGSGKVLKDDWYYFNNKLYMSLPFNLAWFRETGTIRWKLDFSLNGNWAFDGIQNDWLRGLNINWGQAFYFGKVDWKKNFRLGYSFNISNTYGYKYKKESTKEKVAVGISTELKGYYTVADKIGFNTRFYFYYNHNAPWDSRVGGRMRGILNSRVRTDMAMVLNLDMPIKLFTVNIQSITEVNWTRLIGFELHFSPFLDIALVHDTKSKTYFNPKYGWYSGGIEFLVYPITMRSVFGRISYGVDLSELKERWGAKATQKAKRDGKALSELFIGIGLFY